MVGNWLYGVAHQTALNARAAAIRKRKRESPVIDLAERPRADNLHELMPFLDQFKDVMTVKWAWARWCRNSILMCSGPARKGSSPARPGCSTRSWLRRARG
jgi:hypothetical protein